MQRVLLVADDDRVPGVVAAVELHDVVDRPAELVGGLALALVAPLGADEHEGGHGYTSSRTTVARAGPAAGLCEEGYVTTLLVVTNARRQHGRGGGRRGARRAAAAPTSRSCAEPGGPRPALDRLDGRTLVIAGGDGSLHLAVRRCASAASCRRTGRSGCVPLGTGNDLARALGIPLDPAEAARRCCRPAAADRPGRRRRRRGRRQRGARRHRRGGRRAARGALKPRLGKPAYAVGGVAGRAGATGWRLRVEVDGAR